MPRSKVKGPRGRNADGRHLMRYLKRKAGMTPEKIAEQEHVSARAVYDSIRQIEVHETKNSEGQLQLAVRDLIISTVPQAKETLQGLLTATELVEVKNHKTGRMENVVMEDKTTRLEAVRVFGQIATGMANPKVPLTQVNVNQTNQTANLGSAESYEERLRRLRTKAQEFNALPPEVAAVPQSIDSGEDDDSDFDGDEEDEDE